MCIISQTRRAKWGPRGHVTSPNWMEIQSRWIKRIRCNPINQWKVDMWQVRGPNLDSSLLPNGLGGKIRERKEGKIRERKEGILEREAPTSL